MINLSSKFDLERWYNIMMLLSVLLFGAVSAGWLPNLPTVPTLLLSVGLFFISLGENVNHSKRSYLQPYLGLVTTISGIERYDRTLGWFFNILGMVFVVWAAIKFLSL